MVFDEWSTDRHPSGSHRAVVDNNVSSRGHNQENLRMFSLKYQKSN
jgi:hypothetical protein